MSDLAISVNKIGKKYQLGATVSSDTIRDSIANGFKRLFRKGDLSKKQEFWALKDISFEVNKGEVLGLIGRNGAGKSTVLKILSRITEPTTGEIRFHGRIASLLEVGTGFHGELSGRENIFLNGSILGMSRSEIISKFDDIVEFAEIRDFLDTPVKRYSSGMFVRLAFAIAAHLEPDILVIDEVLAVGDLDFQKKCLGKMEDVAGEGRTVIFVSHNMGLIKALCSRAILLNNGCIETDGNTHSVIEQYLSDGDKSERHIQWNELDAPKGSNLMLNSISICDHKGSISSELSTYNPISIEIKYNLTGLIKNLRVMIRISTQDGTDLFESSDYLDWKNEGGRPAGEYISRCEIPGGLFNLGVYHVVVFFDVPGQYAITKPVLLSFSEVVLMKNSMGISIGGRPEGLIHPDVNWEIIKC